MRITNKMLSNNFLRDMRTNMSYLSTLQEQMTSGKEVRRPSDDPFKVARAMQLHTEINTNKQYNSNIKDTINWLDTTDTALGQAGDILQRVRELLVSSGNGGYSESERKAIKDEINEKISEFAQVMNTNFDGKYIFGGTRGTTKPMDTIGGSSFDGAAETEGLNFSGVDSLLDKEGKLKKDISIEFSVGGITEKITINAGVTIKNFSELANKINEKIQENPGLKGKVQVTADAVNNKLEFRNNSEDKITITDGTGNLGIPSDKEINGGKSISSGSLNLSGIDSFVKNGKLKDDLTIKLGELGDVIIEKDTPISNLSDLSREINVKIEKLGINDKIKVVPDLADGTLKFVNIDSESTNGIEISMKLGNEEKIDDSSKKAEYNDNNNENTRLFYYQKGGGELLGGDEYYQICQMQKVAISQGVLFDYNVNVTQVVEFKNGKGEEKDLREIFNNIVNHLDGKDADGKEVDSDAVKELINNDLQDITDSINNTLKLRSEVGAKQNSMESARDKNIDQNFNMTEILSKTEDIDITEKTMEYSMAQTVYIASLQTSARVLQPTLIDYIR